VVPHPARGAVLGHRAQRQCGWYFASFVIDTDPAADAARMPAAGKAIGIDLSLTSDWWARTDRSSINVKQAAL
jgi:putative transposase